DRLQLDHFCNFDLADLPLHPGLLVRSLVARVSEATPGIEVRISLRSCGLRQCPYLAQSTTTVPSLSPFSTARCACAVSDSAYCPATLCRRAPARSHFVMSACAAACKGGGSVGSTSGRSAMQRSINSRTGSTGVRFPLVA